MISQKLAAESGFPLLLHIDDIINHGARVDIPWSKFETEN
jgi:glycerol-3-phosphate dehydrogenase (NAD(P)+)